MLGDVLLGDSMIQASVFGGSIAVNPHRWRIWKKLEGKNTCGMDFGCRRLEEILISWRFRGERGHGASRVACLRYGSMDYFCVFDVSVMWV